MSHSSAVRVRLAFILLSGAIVLAFVREGGAGLLVLLVLLALCARRRWPGAGDTHGTAAFASAHDVRAAGMTEGGVHLGELVDPTPPPPLARALGQVIAAPLSHSAPAVENLCRALGEPPARLRLWAKDFTTISIFAASRSGKGASVLIPTLLTYSGPVLILDPKAEIFLQVRAAREALGRQVFCIDPYRIAHADGGHTFNQMSYVSAADPFLIDIAKDMSAALVVRTGEEKERFFPDASEHLIQTVISAILWGGEAADRNLATVADVIASPDLLANTLAAIQHTDAFGGALRTLGRQAAQLEGRERASVLSSIAAQYLGWINSVPVRDTIRTSTVDPVWLKTGDADLFVCIPPERLRSASGFVRYLLNGILRRLVQGPPDESRPVLVILDEASSLGRLNILEEAVTLFAGWGVKIIFVWQSLGQVQDSFPGDKAKTFLANNSVQIFGKTNDLETAKHISERIGDATVLTTSVQDGGSSSHSTGSDGRQGSGQRSTSWSVTRNESGRRLARPEEILIWPPELMTVFTDRTAPVLVRQVRFYAPEFWHTARAGVTGFRPLAAVAVLLLLVLALAGFLDRPVPVPVNYPYTPGRGSGRPAGGDSVRPTKGPNDGKENRRGPRPGDAQKRPG